MIFAAGASLDTDSLANFRGERTNPLNVNRYIHTKFMLVDPLSDDPLVVTGSANFSRPSQRVNDENMLVIRGDTRVADIYFGEFMRIFDHHYARYIVRKLAGRPTSPIRTPDTSKEKTADWLPPTSTAAATSRSGGSTSHRRRTDRAPWRARECERLIAFSCSVRSRRSVPTCSFIPEVPPLALARLLHLRVTFPGRVLGRGRCRNDRGIHNRAGLEQQLLLLQ